MVRHYATRKTFLMHLVTHALGEQCGLFVAAPLLEAKLYAPDDHCRRAQLAGVDLEFMLAAAARGSQSKTRRIFSITHSNPRTCESADFAYGRPSGPYRASTVRF